MDIQLKKIEIIHWLTKLSEKSIIEELLALKSKYSNTEESTIINELLAQSEEDISKGDILSHEKVMHDMREKYGIKTK